MRFTLRLGDREHEVAVERAGDRVKVVVDGETVEAEASRGRDATTVVVEGRAFEIRIGTGEVVVDGVAHPIGIADLAAGGGAGAHAAGAHGRVKPPMPGKIVAVKVQAGDTVTAGQTLFVLEAMKMQNEVGSPVAGVVKEVKVQPGQAVEAKDVAVVIE